MCLDGRGVEVAVGDHQRREPLTPLGVVDSDHGGVGHRRVVTDALGDRRRHDELPSGENQFVAPADHPQPAGVVAVADITGV